MSVAFQLDGAQRPSPTPPEVLVVTTVQLDEHFHLVSRSVDRFDVAAHLEASGFGDALARRHGAHDVYDYARSLPALPAGTSEPIAIRPRIRREGWIRALLLLAGAMVMALCAHATTGFGSDFSVSIIATGLAGWVLGQLVGFVTWRRAGRGDLVGAARYSVGAAGLALAPFIAGVTAISLLLSGSSVIPTVALSTAWSLYAVSLTLVSVLGGLRPLVVLAVTCAVVSLLATVTDNHTAPIAALVVLAMGGVALAARTYLATTTLAPALPSRPDLRAGLAGACQAALMSCALLLALDLADADDRIPLSVAVILAAALCDPAIEDLGSRLRSLSHRSRQWRAVLVGVLLRTLIYLFVIACSTFVAAWIVDQIMVLDEHGSSALVPDAVMVVVGPVYAVFAFGSAIVLRAGRASQAVWLAALACLGYAVLQIGLPVVVGVVVLGTACLLAVFQAVAAALHPHSW